MKSALGMASIAAAGYLFLLLYVWLSQSRLLYLPDFAGREVRATPADIGLAFEDVHLLAADGVRLHGWLVPARQRRGSLVFFHGNAGNIGHRLSSIALFESLGLDVLIIDYRGYGQSEGQPDEAGTYLDAQAAWDWLVRARGTDPGEIVIFGRSLGGAVAAWLGARVRPAGLILESTFTSVPDAARSVYWFLPVRWLSRFCYDTRSALEKVSAPVLVIHSRDDEIIPFRHAAQLYEAAMEPKWLQPLEGGHNDAIITSRAAYLDALEGFMSRVLALDGA